MIAHIGESDRSSKQYRKKWARLIKKICEMDPVTSPKCEGQRFIISFIEDREVINRILKHLGIWLVKKKPSPRANAPRVDAHLNEKWGQYCFIDNVDRVQLGTGIFLTSANWLKASLVQRGEVSWTH